MEGDESFLEITGLRLVSLGVMLLQSYDRRPLNRRNLTAFMDWQGEAERWRESLIEVTGGPLVPINANLIYLQGKIEQIVL